MPVKIEDQARHNSDKGVKARLLFTQADMDNMTEARTAAHRQATAALEKQGALEREVAALKGKLERRESGVPSIYDLELHECCRIDEVLEVTRVPGGWRYRALYSSDTGFFVPFHPEFRPKDKVT